MRKRGYAWLMVAGLILLPGCGWMKLLEQPVTTFFEKVAAGDLDGAYQLTSEAFRKQTSKAQLKAFLEGSGLDDYASASWRSFSIDNDTGKLKGTVTTRKGGTIPVTVHLVREQGSWHIHRIQLEAAGVRDHTEDQPTGKAQPQLPPKHQWPKLATDAVVLLGEAINQDDYRDFLAAISPVWRSQIGESELRAAFAQFHEKGIDLTRVRGVNPEFSGPAVRDENGLMKLSGIFPTAPYQVHFKLTFHYDGDRWRLFGISVDAK